MKIIDAHIHYCPKKPYFDTIAREAGHENTESHLLREFKRLGIEHAVVMGNQTLDSDAASFPAAADRYRPACGALPSGFPAGRARRLRMPPGDSRTGRGKQDDGFRDVAAVGAGRRAF